MFNVVVYIVAFLVFAFGSWLALLANSNSEKATERVQAHSQRTLGILIAIFGTLVVVVVMNLLQWLWYVLT